MRLMINATAKPNAGVLMLTHYRFWLRPVFLRRASTRNEQDYLASDVDLFWRRFKKSGFRFILVDSSVFARSMEIMEVLPSNYPLQEP